MYEYKELYTLDFTNVEYFFEFHYVIKKELDFPDYYGCNWSAFWDCIMNIIGEPIHIEIIGLENIERRFGNDFTKNLIDILKDVKHYDNDRYSHEIQIAIVSGEHRVNIE